MAAVPPDQTMEQILASIRQVINAEAEAAPPLPATLAPPFEEADEDVLELGQDAPAEADDMVAPTGQGSSPPATALDALAIDPRADVTSLDGLVREMLRPMLREWLDAHLPDLVEREVARMVRR